MRTSLARKTSDAGFHLASFLCGSALALLDSRPSPQKIKYLFNRFCIALAFPFLAHADVLSLMEPFILLNGEKDFCTHTNWAAIRIITRNRSRKGSCVAWSEVPWQQTEGIKIQRYFLYNIHLFLYVISCWALTCPKPPWAPQVLFPGKQVGVTVGIPGVFCWYHQNRTRLNNVFEICNQQLSSEKSNITLPLILALFLISAKKIEAMPTKPLAFQLSSFCLCHWVKTEKSYSVSNAKNSFPLIWSQQQFMNTFCDILAGFSQKAG